METASPKPMLIPIQRFHIDCGAPPPLRARRKSSRLVFSIPTLTDVSIGVKRVGRTASSNAASA